MTLLPPEPNWLKRTASQRLLGKTERLFFMRPLYRKLYGCWRSGLITFVLSNDRLRGEAFTGSFSHQRLERILEIFKISSNIKWRYLDTHNIENEKAKVEIY